MNRNEMIKQSELLRMRDRFGPVSEEELASFPVSQKKLLIPMECGRHIHVYEIRPNSGLVASSPILINFHGGGFIKPRTARDHRYCAFLAAQLGILIWDVDYCLAPEQPFPAAPEECFHVYRYVLEHADILGINPQWIFLAGHSAGGNLAAGVCIQAIRKSLPVPKAMLLEYFPCDAATPPLEKLPPELRASEPHAERAKTEQLYNEFYYGRADVSDPLASPLFASTDILAQFPPCLILSAAQDSLRAETEQFARKLVEFGVVVSTKRFTKSRHGFTINRTEEWEDALKLHLSFFHSHLFTI